MGSDTFLKAWNVSKAADFRGDTHGHVFVFLYPCVYLRGLCRFSYGASSFICNCAAGMGGEPIVNLVFPLNPTMVGHIIFEEIVWRVCPCYLMISESLPPIRCVFLAVVLSLLFVFGHKLYSVRDFIERFCFTTLLYIGAMMWPGFNFGLHLGRNAWTAGSSDKNEEI